MSFLGSGDIKALIWVTDGQELAIGSYKLGKAGKKLNVYKKAREGKKMHPLMDYPSTMSSCPILAILAVLLNCKQEGWINR